MRGNEDGTEQNQLLERCGQVKGPLVRYKGRAPPSGCSASHRSHTTHCHTVGVAAAPPYLQVGSCMAMTYTNFIHFLPFFKLFDMRVY